MPRKPIDKAQENGERTENNDDSDSKPDTL